MRVALIWAQAANRVIGRDGAIPWRLPEDMAMFRALTLGSTVVMGRRTWESLPTRVRPLDGRRNLVLSRQPNWTAPGADVVASLAAAMEQTDGPLWVIGGAQVYNDALPHAHQVVVTEVAGSYDGDTYAPTLDAPWSVASSEPTHGWSTSSTGLRYRVRTYERSAVSVTGSDTAARYR